MKGYDKGTVCFDQLTVIGREFVSTTNPLATSYWDYCFTASCRISDEKRKKGAPENYNYSWDGHLNIGIDGVRVHLHNIDDDVGLVKQESKLQLLQDTLKEFLKLYKGWGKEEKDPVVAKHWLNPEDSRYTGLVSYNLERNGTGSVSIGDCHKTIVIWVPVPYAGRHDLANRSAKQIDELVKGVGKAIAAIHQLRKFFEREVFDAAEK
jgi:hypothetical protein